MKNIQNKIAISLELQKHDVSMIKDIIFMDNEKIKSTFQNEVKNMREIRSDICSVKNNLHNASNNTDTSIKEKIVKDSVEQTQDILDRTDGVIASLQSFVEILQSEDRLMQIIYGLESLQDDLLQDTRIDIERESEERLRETLSKHYKIQEQRDFALKREKTKEKARITLF